jgi:hypothetical protein
MMVEAAKITLSHKELELVCNTDWIFTKHTVIQKVVQLFGNLIPHLENELEQAKELLPKEIFINRAKISKGENYQLLPYVMLDYPRCFDKNDTLAIRTFFWWGNFFSITLQLSGKYKAAFQQNLLGSFHYLQQNNYCICIHDTPWEHDFSNNNYLSMAELTQEKFTAILSRKPFLKLAKNIPIRSWETVPAFVVKSFFEMMQLMKTG